MDIAALVHSYGLLAVGLGAFLEGESVLLIAGAAASRGHLWLPAVVAVAALASFVGDQFYFSLGRKYGKTLLARFPALAPRAARVDALLARWHLPFVLSIRFLYGLRVAGPFAVGMSSVPWSRFLALNLAGAWLWAWLVAAAGYFGGQLLGHALAAIDADELWELALLAAVFGGAWLLARRARAQRR
ncbi:MAG: DedA family protein [Burkholderiales bacterium]|nr:DedA family protein [Burkholderiales bacterium]